VTVAHAQEIFVDEEAQRSFYRCTIAAAEALGLRERQAQAWHLLELRTNPADERALRHDGLPCESDTLPP
jgi:hypothetical protein